jgi:hypothetical protein
MRQSQAEIKAIEAELRSIRVDQPARPVTLLDPNAHWEVAEPPISPTITRQSTALHTSPRSPKGPAVQSSERRSGQAVVECFPLPDPKIAELRPRALTRETDPSKMATVVRQLRQPRRRQSAPAVQMALVQQREAVRQQVEAKARQINSLSQQQESIIRELAALSDQIEQAWQSADPELHYPLEPICEYLGTEIPCVEQDENGTLLLTTREIEWQPNQHSHPRSKSSTHRPLFPLGRFVWQATLGTLGLVATVGRTAATLAGLLITTPIRLVFGQTASEPRRRTYRGSGRRTAAPETPFTLQSALLIVAGSAALRFGLDWVVVLYPHLWLPSIVVMVAPALFAVYQSTVAPQSGFAWGYRLFSILIGLLIGGRL